MKSKCLDHARLLHLLDYDTESGNFYRKQTLGKCIVGQTAGTKNGCGYLIVWVGGERFLAHRLAWFFVHGVWPENDIDHINGVRTDNRISNLRKATRAQNSMNTKLSIRNTSGLKGVSWHPRDKYWRARCSVNGKQNELGRFKTKDEAFSVYLKFAREHHKEFLRT